jgi:hypothetical protein
MRSLVVDKLTNCEMIVLNRTPANVDKEEIHKVIRSVSRRTAITYDYPDGHVEYDEIEDPLPFDLNAPVVNVEDNDYAIFYRDLSEEMEKLEAVTKDKIKFNELVFALLDAYDSFNNGEDIDIEQFEQILDIEISDKIDEFVPEE